MLGRLRAFGKTPAAVPPSVNLTAKVHVQSRACFLPFLSDEILRQHPDPCWHIEVHVLLPRGHRSLERRWMGKPIKTPTATAARPRKKEHSHWSRTSQADWEVRPEEGKPCKPIAGAPLPEDEGVGQSLDARLAVSRIQQQLRLRFHQRPSVKLIF